MQQELFIAGASVRAAARSARDAGYGVTAADLFGDRDLASGAEVHRLSDYPSEIAVVAARLSARSWLYTGGLENHPGLVARVSRRHALLGNPAVVLDAVRDPWRVQAVLRAAGLASPELSRTEPVDPQARWLSKPLRSCGGRQIYCCGTTAPAPASGGRYFQREVGGTACGAVFVAAQQSAFLVGVSRQIRGWPFLAESEPFAHVGAVGPVTLDEPLRAQFQAIGKCLATEFALQGLFGVDVIVTRNSVWTLEVNPRFTASVELHERALDWNALSAHVAACTEGALPGDAATARTCWGKAVVYADQPLTVSQAFGDWADSQNAAARQPSLLDLPWPGTRIAGGQPMLSVMAEGRSPQEAERRLRELAGTVRAVSGRLHPAERAESAVDRDDGT